MPLRLPHGKNAEVHGKEFRLAMVQTSASESRVSSSGPKKRFVCVCLVDTLGDRHYLRLSLFRRLLQPTEILQYPRSQVDVHFFAGYDFYHVGGLLFVGLHGDKVSWTGLVLLVAARMHR